MADKSKEQKHTHNKGQKCEYCTPKVIKEKDHTGKTVERQEHDITICHPTRGFVIN